MNNSMRCLYDSSFAGFLDKKPDSIFAALCDRYHGEALTGPGARLHMCAVGRRYEM